MKDVILEFKITLCICQVQLLIFSVFFFTSMPYFYLLFTITDRATFAKNTTPTLFLWSKLQKY